MTDKDTLMNLIYEYAEVRHINGCWVYNTKTAAARQAVIEALRGVQALSAAPAGVAPTAPTPQHIVAMERAWLWMDNQADQQSKGGHATFDLMMLRKERDALREAIDGSQDTSCEHCHGSGEVLLHTDDCDDELCALNGDQHSCAGKVEDCQCVAPIAASPTPPAEQQAITPETGNSASAQGAAITSESGAVYAELCCDEVSRAVDVVVERCISLTQDATGIKLVYDPIILANALRTELRDFADRTHALRMEQSAPKAAPVKACVCGEPQASGTVHRVDGPCYVAAPQQEAHHLTQALTDPENQPNQYGVEFGMSGQQMHFKIGNQLFRLAYEPDDQQEFEFMKRMLIHAFSTFTPDVKAAPQPAPQGETNAQLDTDSNSPTPGQQRDVAGPVAVGQPVGHGSDSKAGDPSAQRNKLLTVAERNIRSFLRSAVFKSESDREAALNCVDVLWEAARAPADSGAAPAATVIKKGADRQWMSERLGHLPDGIYSLYLAPQQEAQEPAFWMNEKGHTWSHSDWKQFPKHRAKYPIPLYPHFPAPQPAPAELERLRERIARMGLDVDRAMRGHVNEQSPLGTQRLAAIAALAKPAPAPLSDDTKRLAWMADGWTPGHEKLYDKHVLETGGVGGLDDLRTFIDKQIAAQGDKP